MQDPRSGSWEGGWQLGVRCGVGQGPSSEGSGMRVMAGEGPEEEDRETA